MPGEIVELSLNPTIVVTLAAVGVATGALIGLTGASGMSVLISGLLLAGIDIRMVIGLTFVVTLANSVSSIIPYWRYGLVDRRIGIIVSVSAASMVFVGHYFAGMVPGDWLKALIVVCLLAIGVKFWWPTRGVGDGQVDERPVRNWVLVLFGMLTGTVMGITGGGGGVLIAAFLILAFGVRVKVAIGSSILIMAIAAIPGVMLHCRDGTVPWMIAAIVITTSMVAAFMSAQFASHVHENTVKRILGAYLIAVSSFMLLSYAF